MYWIYILKNSHREKLYIGMTNNLARRLREHNEGKSQYTRSDGQWVLIYCEGYRHKSDAVDREKKLKQFKNAYVQLKRRIRNSLSGAS